jgi:hypothetical protein
MDDVYQELSNLSARYSNLRSLFAQFYKEGKPTLTGGSIRGIVVGELVDDRSFDVSLAGTTARIVFSFPHGGFHARVACYRLDQLKPEVLESVAHFDFNGEGVVAGMTEPKSGDHLKVSYDAHAS